MGYLNELTESKFKNLTWFISDVQVNVAEEEDGKAFVGGDVFYKLESDRNSEEDDEDLPLLWFQFTADVDNSGFKSEVTNIEAYDDFDVSSNLISFCREDHHLAENLMKDVIKSSKWQEEVYQAIRAQF